MEKESFCDEEILTRGHIFKDENAKFMWDFEHHFSSTKPIDDHI